MDAPAASPSSATDARWDHVADAARLSLVVGVPVALLADGLGSAYGMALIAIVAVAARTIRAPARVGAMFVTLLALDGWLTLLGAFAEFNRNDAIGHLLLPAAITPMLYYLVTRLGVVRGFDGEDTIGRLAGICVLASLTIALGTCWELTEWLSDIVLGTNMSLGYTDTLGDLAADTTGAVLGSVLTARFAPATAVTAQEIAA